MPDAGGVAGLQAAVAAYVSGSRRGDCSVRHVRPRAARECRQGRRPGVVAAAIRGEVRQAYEQEQDPGCGGPGVWRHPRAGDARGRPSQGHAVAGHPSSSTVGVRVQPDAA